MPLYLKETNENYTLGIWKITEPLEYFESNTKLNRSEIEFVSKFSNEYRKKEFIAVRTLLKEISEENYIIQYNEDGKPYLSEKGTFISISHTKNFVSVILSDKSEIGIDIEYIAERAIKIRSKFLDETEQKWCDTIEKHIICWSAKETVFKIYGKQLDFKDISISKFNILKDNGYIDAKIKNRDFKSFKVKYQKIENNFLTFTLNS